MSEIVIRHVETTDAQALHHLYSQTPVYRDTLQLPLPSVESRQKRLANPEPARITGGLHRRAACRPAGRHAEPARAAATWPPSASASIRATTAKASVAA